VRWRLPLAAAVLYEPAPRREPAALPRCCPPIGRLADAKSVRPRHTRATPGPGLGRRCSFARAPRAARARPQGRTGHEPPSLGWRYGTTVVCTNKAGYKTNARVRIPGGRRFAETSLATRSTTYCLLAVSYPADAPRTLHRRAVCRSFAGTSIGETGFEPAAARPPAGAIRFCGATFGVVEPRWCRSVALSCAHIGPRIAPRDTSRQDRRSSSRGGRLADERSACAAGAKREGAISDVTAADDAPAL